MGTTEAATIALAQNGDLDAFHRLVDCYADRLYRVAFRITRSREDAEDVVQEAFIKAYQHLQTFDARATFGTWMHRIVTNRCLDLLRSRRRKDDHNDPLEGHDYSLANGEPDPERHVLGRELETKVEEVMASLTDLERTAFVLRHYEQATTAEIGERLGMKPNAAKQTVFRAVRKVRSALEPVMRSA